MGDLGHLPSNEIIPFNFITNVSCVENSIPFVHTSSNYDRNYHSSTIDHKCDIYSVWLSVWLPVKSFSRFFFHCQGPNYLSHIYLYFFSSWGPGGQFPGDRYSKGFCKIVLDSSSWGFWLSSHMEISKRLVPYLMYITSFLQEFSHQGALISLLNVLWGSSQGIGLRMGKPRF